MARLATGARTGAGERAERIARIRGRTGQGRPSRAAVTCAIDPEMLVGWGIVRIVTAGWGRQ